jgi:DNA-binding FadR family transcriptional regulator
MNFGQGFEPDVVDTRSAAEQIAAQLHQALVTRELRPGDRLPPEAELAKGFAVSRSTVREAVKAAQGPGAARNATRRQRRAFRGQATS